MEKDHLLNALGFGMYVIALIVGFLVGCYAGSQHKEEPVVKSERYAPYARDLWYVSPQNDTIYRYETQRFVYLYVATDRNGKLIMFK